MAERMIDAGGVKLCTEPFGDPADEPILLIQGIGASMVWWDDAFCRMLSGSGRFVIRYDHRDTGRSVAYEPGRPGYTAADLVADATGVLDAYDLPAAHVVGVSAGGAFAQLLALEFPGRVRSLVLISTSPATPGERHLPPPTEAFQRFVATARVDRFDRESVVEFLTGYCGVLAGPARRFDEGRMREFVLRDLARARNHAAAANHDLLAEGRAPGVPLSAITVPTLVIHGTADPMFPVEHGVAVAREIPGATLLMLDGAGHGVDPADHESIAAAIIRHTSSNGRAG
jgi:pimeloyl-ACP methyl ester carboxylesterase